MRSFIIIFLKNIKNNTHGVRSFIITFPLTCLPSYSAHQSGLPPQPSCGDPKDRQAPPHHLAHRCLRSLPARAQAGVRSFIITFDVYVILNIFEKYDNKRPDAICLICLETEFRSSTLKNVNSNKRQGLTSAPADVLLHRTGALIDSSLKLQFHSSNLRI